MTDTTSVESGIYGQLMREFVTREHGLLSDDVVAVTVDAADRLWAATPAGVAVLDGKAWRTYGPQQGLADAVGLGDAGIGAIAALGDTVWVATSQRLYRLVGDAFEEVAQAPVAPFTALQASHGKLLVAGADCIAIHDSGTWRHIPYPRPFAVNDLLLDGDGVLWLATDQGLWGWNESSWDGCVAGGEHSGPAADGVGALALDGAGVLWVGTTAGLGFFDRRGWWEHIEGKDGLPYETITCIALGGDGTAWVGFPIGCARLRHGEWDYFANLRWLRDDRVRSIAVRRDGSAWVATSKGLSRIWEQPMTLAQKAAHFEQRLQERHYRMGYVAPCLLEMPGVVDTFVPHADDNDGLWTALYVAAECYRCAVTGEQEARDRVRVSVHAMIELERKTPIPGFPARSIIMKGERVRKSGGEWHDTEDGEWEWKGDTSSDEIDGHFYAYGLYYDLVADAAEKDDIRGVCRRIMDHIIEHGYLLVDADGERTTWGVWSPELLNGPWQAQRGLNSLEILSYLKTTYHVTGDEKYQQHYLHLALDHHYALNTLHQKICYPGEVNHSDDELAIIAYDSLLRYEQDPSLRAIYLASLERTWRIERPEHSPFQNYVYSALTGKSCDIEESLQTLRDIPWDTVAWTMKNSHRADVVADVSMGRSGERQATEAIKPHERGMLKWNGNPYRMDDGRDGRSEDDGAFFLLPYWLGRYYGFIRERE